MSYVFVFADTLIWVGQSARMEGALPLALTDPPGSLLPPLPSPACRYLNQSGYLSQKHTQSKTYCGTGMISTSATFCVFFSTFDKMSMMSIFSTFDQMSMMSIFSAFDQMSMMSITFTRYHSPHTTTSAKPILQKAEAVDLGDLESESAYHL